MLLRGYLRATHGFFRIILMILLIDHIIRSEVHDYEIPSAPVHKPSLRINLSTSIVEYPTQAMTEYPISGRGNAVNTCP